MHEYWVEFCKFAVAHALAVASPGPDFALVVKQSLSMGSRAGLWTSVGIGTAILLHVGYSLLGLGLLIRGSEGWYNVVKYAGAAYLAWLGMQALRSRPSDIAGREPVGPGASVNGGKAFGVGFLTNALNPKATLFFLSLFALVVSPETPQSIQAGYGIWMALATMGWFSIVSLLFTRLRARRIFLRHGQCIDRTLGGVFLVFAASMVFTSLS